MKYQKDKCGPVALSCDYLQYCKEQGIEVHYEEMPGPPAGSLVLFEILCPVFAWRDAGIPLKGFKKVGVTGIAQRLPNLGHGTAVS